GTCLKSSVQGRLIESASFFVFACTNCLTFWMICCSTGDAAVELGVALLVVTEPAACAQRGLQIAKERTTVRERNFMSPPTVNLQLAASLNFCGQFMVRHRNLLTGLEILEAEGIGLDFVFAH